MSIQLQSSDEEAPAEEEAEVLRLQRKAAAALRPEDYEQDDEDDESSGGEETLQVKSIKSYLVATRATSNLICEVCLVFFLFQVTPCSMYLVHTM